MNFKVKLAVFALGLRSVNFKIKMAVFASGLRLVNFKIKKVGSVCIGTSLSEL